MVAIEDAGFEIRDCMMWLYGTGFPKSYNISKGMDKKAGATREVVGRSSNKIHLENIGPAGYKDEWDITVPATAEALEWDGWGTALKPAWEPIVVAMKPLDGTFVNNALTWGVAGMWIDGGRIETNGESITINRWDDGSKPFGNGAGHPYTTSMGTEGRWPANVILGHHPECVPAGVAKIKGHSGYPNGPGGKSMHYSDQDSRGSEVRPEAWAGHADEDGMETVEVWDCHPDCPAHILAEQKGHTDSGKKGPLNHSYTIGGNAAYGGGKGVSTFSHGDSGSVARFFYCAKAPQGEKWIYCSICDDAFPIASTSEHIHGQDNKDHIIIHPTQKPIEIVRYLARLSRTPSGGSILDPFMGTGSTGKAAQLEGRPFIGIDNSHSSYTIASRRMEQPAQLSFGI